MSMPRGRLTAIADYGHELILFFEDGEEIVIQIAEDGDWIVWKMR